MSYQSGGPPTDLIYASVLPGTAKASFTSEFKINDTTGMGPTAMLLPQFFLPSGSIAKGIRIIARGIFSSTGTPTYTFSIRGGTEGSTSAAILLGSAALTTTSGASNTPFEIEGDIFMRTLGAAGANSTVQGVGRILSPGLATSYAALWGGASSPGAVATFDHSIANFVNFNVTCSANSASNTITLQQLAVIGWN